MSFYPNDIEEAAKAQWRDHMAPLEAIGSGTRAAEASRKAEELLDDEVKLARAAGASWSAIGAAVQCDGRSSGPQWWPSKLRLTWDRTHKHWLRMFGQVRPELVECWRQ